MRLAGLALLVAVHGSGGYRVRDQVESVAGAEVADAAAARADRGERRVLLG